MGVVSLVECFGRSNRKYRRIDWRCDADSAAGKGLTSTGRPVAVRMLAIVDVGSRPTNAFRPIPESRAGCLRSFNAPNSLRVLCCNETPLILSHSSFPSNPHQSSVEPPIKPLQLSARIAHIASSSSEQLRHDELPPLQHLLRRIHHHHHHYHRHRHPLPPTVTTSSQTHHSARLVSPAVAGLSRCIPPALVSPHLQLLPTRRPHRPSPHCFCCDVDWTS